MSKKLYVGNLSFKVTDSSIREAFSAFGTTDSINIITDRETGRPRGFAFVEMSTEKEAQAAIDGLNGRELDGRELTVNVAKAREDRGGGRSRGGW